jgi:hypothetical protein
MSGSFASSASRFSASNRRLVRSFRAVLAVLGLLVVGSSLAGCVDTAQLQAFRTDLVQLKGDLHQEAENLQEQLAQLDPTHPLHADVRAALSRARAKEAAATAAVEQADLVLTRATDPQSPVAQTVNQLAPWLPAAAQLPLALGIALAASLGRAVQLKRGMISIAQGFQKALEEDEAFAARFREHANTFRTIQTRTARRVVDEATSDRSLRLPV